MLEELKRDNIGDHVGMIHWDRCRLDTYKVTNHSDSVIVECAKEKSFNESLME